jgi:hypothetical protein
LSNLRSDIVNKIKLNNQAHRQLKKSNNYLPASKALRIIADDVVGGAFARFIGHQVLE